MAVFPAVFGLLMAALVTGQHVDIQPPEAVRSVGDSLDVVCKVPYAIDSCMFQTMIEAHNILQKTDNEEVMYIGEGFAKGECGVRIRHIKEAMNGNITCGLSKQTGSALVRTTMRLIVAKEPEAPILEAPPQTAFNEGDVFRAQCVVPGGRPAATISWKLDDEQLLTDLHQPIITTVPGTDLQTISQNISRTLSADDQDKTLTCIAEHQSLQQAKQVSRQLSVQYAPKVESTTITIFGLQLNAEGRLNVTVRAHPAPTAEWQVEGQKLVAPASSDDQQIMALQPMLLPEGGGHYNVTLILHQIKKEDVDRTYYLRLSNDLGNVELAIRISTMEEPAGVELETGAIVGIVIAVLVLLIAISLIVFAYATDRWCFAGRRRDNTKSSGESSDTESAVGGKERSRLAQLSARVLAALPRKDKVQATEAVPHEDEEKPADDKVVYATLALSEQTPAEKPPPAFAEYAEIVYTDQGQKEVKENA